MWALQAKDWQGTIESESLLCGVPADEVHRVVMRGRDSRWPLTIGGYPLTRFIDTMRIEFAVISRAEDAHALLPLQHPGRYLTTAELLKSPIRATGAMLHERVREDSVTNYGMYLTPSERRARTLARGNSLVYPRR
jgi:hypothetical protein